MHIHYRIVFPHIYLYKGVMIDAVHTMFAPAEAGGGSPGPGRSANGALYGPAETMAKFSAAKRVTRRCRIKSPARCARSLYRNSGPNQLGELKETKKGELQNE